MNNVTVITSGTAGIGKAIAKKIISTADFENGDRIIINYGHDDDAALHFLSEFPNDIQKSISLIKADLSQYKGMEFFANNIRSLTDHIDWLVYNTGIGSYLPFEEYTYDIWDTILRTNLSIPAFFIKEIKPLMASNGNIVFMGSHAGQVPYSRSIVYSVSKAGVMFLAKSLVKVFDQQQVSVNAIAPGFIETRWQEGRSEESYQRVNNKIAAHRFGTPEEVAELCYAILNNDYINGSIYDIHGGYDYF